MKCAEFRRNSHEFIDFRLSAGENKSMERHLSSCVQCNDYCSDLRFIREVVHTKSHLPDPAAERILARVSQPRRSWLTSWLHSLWSRGVDCWRDCEGGAFWARASALPISLVFMFLLFGNLAPIRVERLAYLIVSHPSWANEQTVDPVVLNVIVLQDRGDLTELVDTAWRLPYEDSLAVVAEIKPDGHAEINSVLESPKSFALLDAVGSTLKTSQFEQIGGLASPFLIYSFQKIDVYERGL